MKGRPTTSEDSLEYIVTEGRMRETETGRQTETKSERVSHIIKIC